MISKCEYGNGFTWEVKPQEGKCDKCESPRCIYTNNKIASDAFLDNLKILKDRTPEQGRYMAYQHAIRIENNKKMGYQKKKPVCCCFETLTKSTFPSKYLQDLGE